MKTYALKRDGNIVRTTRALSIDLALDEFFPGIEVDVDLDTACSTHLDVQPKKLPRHTIEELTQ